MGSSGVGCLRGSTSDSQNHDPSIAGPDATPLGRFIPAQQLSAGATSEQTVLSGPYVHSVTDRSVNIEWWLSHPSPVALSWGLPGQMSKPAPVHGHQFVSYSILDLEPDTEYQVRLDFQEPLDVIDVQPGGAVDGTSVYFTFRTASTAAEPVAIFVAPDGCDSQSGLSRGEAVQTVNRAASLARPGDTVYIGGGTYHEVIYLRVSGEKGRPITFTCVPGERVVFDGDKRLESIWVSRNKSHIQLDGFYVRNVHKVSHPEQRRNGAIRLYDGEDIDLTRIFYDGRGPGYSPTFVYAENVHQLLIRNCVSINAFGGSPRIGGRRERACPGFRMENTLIIRNMIGGMALVPPLANQQPLAIRNSIFTDCLKSKMEQRVPVAPIGSAEWLALENNAHFLRPERQTQGQLSMDEFRQQVARDGGILGDPRFAIVFHDGGDGGFGFSVDRIFSPELRDRALTFADLFATNPEFVALGIGLDPAAFTDFDSSHHQGATTP